MKKPENSNYAAVIAEVRAVIPLENCDNVVHANVLGNLVIVGKDTKPGDVGVFFPVETQLNSEFLSNNNLYRHAELNVDKTKKGYFEDNGRIKAVKFRSHKSQGLFIPGFDCLSYTNHTETLKVGDEFDELNGKSICRKYVVIVKMPTGTKQGKAHKKKVSRLIENQFRFHIDTDNLGKNLFRVRPESMIQITKKLHGTSCVSSKVLVKKNLNPIMKLLNVCKVPVITTEYGNIYSSRKVVKNDDLNKVGEGFYKEDVWGSANERVKNLLLDGMTIYYEIVGYLASGSPIQRSGKFVYDYGCETGAFEIYVYRITTTNVSGNVFEWSAKQVQQWCKENGVKPVPELYYGYAKDLFPILVSDIRTWQDTFLQKLTERYLDKDCDMCKVTKSTPDEGIVLRIEGLGIQSFKWKSFRFLEAESKSLDSGETNVEDFN